MPPGDLFDEARLLRPFVPAVGVADWIEASFLDESAPLFNPDHAHLSAADVGYLWAAVGNQRQMRRVIGQCEQVFFRAGGWQRARQEQQLFEWFGRTPEFLITFDAQFARDCTDADWCALVEHELYHIGQRVDAFGAPEFTKFGRPKLGMRAHDVEEFVGVVRRYGSVDPAIKQMAAAVRERPLVAQADIARACGTCHLRAA